VRRALDYRKIEPKTWYLPIIFLMPIIMVLAYGILRLIGRSLSEPSISFLSLPILFGVFFFFAALEEIGWMGYAVDPLQERWGAVQAGLILGLVWQLWHVIPHIQGGRTPTWIAWQFFFSVAARVLIVWLYNNTGKSVFAAILFHDMMNVAQFLSPDPLRIDPVVPGLLTAAAAVIVTVMWGPRTLARYRPANPPVGR
jgi:uncharacterized protein